MKPLKTFLIPFIALVFSQGAYSQSVKVWELAKTTTDRIGNGESPSTACNAARRDYFLLLVDDSESIVVFQHPDGACMVSFPSENSRNAFFTAERMVMTQPFSPSADNRPITWIQATLDKSGTTPEFFKLNMLRSKGGVTDVVYLSRKGGGSLVQWTIS